MTSKMFPAMAAVALLCGVATFPISSRAYDIKPDQKALLSSAYIVFHTMDDDKDYDSVENVTVSCGQHVAGILQNAGANNVWRDQSDTPPLLLLNIDHKIEPGDCNTIT